MYSKAMAHHDDKDNNDSIVNKIDSENSNSEKNDIASRDKSKSVDKNNQPVLHDGPLKEFTIVVDPGHGGSDPGTGGAITGVKEKDLNMRISNKLKTKLENLGADIKMTRDDSTNLGENEKLSLDDRITFINNQNPDLLISMHHNFSEQSDEVKGTQILCANKNSIEFANKLQEAFNNEFDNKLYYLMSGYTLLKDMEQPSVIVECGFLSNEEDEARLQTDEYQDQIVSVIVDTVEKFLKD
ncbi:hypothetical protein SH1V18_21410 [Vallitalea longa]|uniref:MurNAc-LAA domain-containing protein n=1 Tax=Vallitalea longa TaxID=2936439 RepID=A0A9W5YBK8_9FIRM|nr:N-acetylmuramoyl-L-alanine amidase [Vallitalea longa]GKX29661.1 hypothetical protein SH1V18_21410 [Vallitalea longa]